MEKVRSLNKPYIGFEVKKEANPILCIGFVISAKQKLSIFMANGDVSGTVTELEKT